MKIRVAVFALVALLTGCGGGGGGGGSGDDWFYHFRCNGDSQCLATNFANASSGTSSDLGPGAGGQASCNSLMAFGTRNWNIPPAQQWCDQSAAFNPPPSPHVDISVSPTAIELGQSSTVAWATSLVSSCSASSASRTSGSWSGSRNTSGSQLVTPSGIGNQDYVLTCTGSSGSAYGVANLAVKDHPVSVTLSASPSTIALGQQTTLTWSSYNVTSCTASGPWSGAQPTSGSAVSQPASAGSFTYTLSCIGTRGSATSSATVTVTGGSPPAAPTVSIAVNPAAPTCVDLGNSASLTWSSTNATSCAASGAWTGPTATSGSQLIYPAADGNAYVSDQKYNYVLNCTGPGGTASAVATACANKSTSTTPAVTVTASVTPGTITLGQSATLTWSSQYAASCAGAGDLSGALPLSGSMSVTPSTSRTYTYTVNCSRNSNTGSASAPLSVQVASGTNPLTARYYTPRALAMNATNDLYVADTNNFTIRRIGHDGVTSTIAGLAGSGGYVDGVGAAARFQYPKGIAVAASGNVYVADTNNMTMRKILPDGTVSTPVGSPGTPGFIDGSGTTARFYYPYGLVTDASENLYIADTSNNSIRMMTSSGATSTIAGNPNSLLINSPTGVTRIGTDLYVADQGNFTIDKIDSNNSVTTFAGTKGTQGTSDGTGTLATFMGPASIAADSSGNLYVLEYGRIRKITTPGAVVTTLALGDFNKDGEGAGITTDSAGNVYVTLYNAIYKITPPSSTLTLFAGDQSTPGSNN